MFDPLIKIYGSAGASMIYTMGKDSGESEVRQLVEDNKENAMFDEEGIIRSCFSEIQSDGVGWDCYRRILWIKQKKIRINVKQNPFIEKCKTELNLGGFLRGLLVGITSDVLEEELSLSDSHCLESSNGSCEFNFVSKD